jgi:hypothetical protein
LDWLRVFAIFVVFIYHTTRFFNIGDWHVKNATTYTGVEIWNIFSTRWMMPLFFVISGASLFYALEKRRGVLRFMRDKGLRLLVPVAVAAFTHSILQVYLERISHNKFSGSFLEFIPHYFSGVYLEIGGRGNFAFHGMHLWYLLFLFVYGLMLYPLFRWFKGGGKDVLETVGRVMAVPGAMYILFPLPFFIMKLIIPGGVLRVGNGGWGFLFYIWYLAAGFIIVSSSKLEEAIQKQRWISFILGAAMSCVYFILRFSSAGESLGKPALKFAGTLYSYIGAWALVLCILGFAMKHMRSGGRFLKYANEGVIAFFILHQTVILCVGYFVVQWSIPDIVKWLAISSVSLVAIVMLYEFLVRRLNIMRFLFGMKIRKRSVS